MFVGRYMICGIYSAVVELYVREGELLRHLYQGNSIDKQKVSIVMQLTLLERSWGPWDPFNHRLHLC